MDTKHYDNKQCIVEFQAFRGNRDEFIIKELVILDLFTNIPYSFVFKPPFAFENCNMKSRRTNQWLSNHYHYINWCEGDVDFNELPNIMKRFCNKFQTIFTTGSEKVTWITKFTSSKVIDLTFPKDLNFIRVLPVCLNIADSNHKSSNCSLAKVFRLSLQMYQYSIQEYKNVEEVVETVI